MQKVSRGRSRLPEVKVIRARLRLTQSQFARWIECNYWTLIAVENNRKSVTKKMKPVITDLFSALRQLDQESMAELIEYLSWQKPSRVNLFEALENLT